MILESQVGKGLPVLETERLVLRLANLNEVPKIVRYLLRNREHLRPWEPLRSDSYFLESAWQGAPERDRAEARSGLAYRFRLLLKCSGDASEGDEFIGTVSLRNIVHFPTYCGTIGYSLDRQYEGLGLMLEAVSAVVRFGFERLNLRRIEACYMPSNVRSERLLSKIGFEIEGLLKSSLEVNGRWEDHRICGLINQHWKRP